MDGSTTRSDYLTTDVPMDGTHPEEENPMARFVKRFGHLAKETGASMVEYTLLVALIAAVCIGALVFLGQKSEESLCETGAAIADTADCVEPAPVVP
jgi:Flp pilus assembly pilin Flp